jgi:hypothetical protein
MAVKDADIQALGQNTNNLRYKSDTSSLGENANPTTPEGLVTTDPVKIFQESVKAGAATLEANLNNFNAAIASIRGDEESMLSSLNKSRINQEAAYNYLSEIESFEDFIEEPTFGGFINQAVGATGQFLPSAAASVGAALTGAAIGAIAGAGTVGAVTTGSLLTSAGTSAVMKTAAQKAIVQKEVNGIVSKYVANAHARKKGLPEAWKLKPSETELIEGAFDILKNTRRAKIGKIATRGGVLGAVTQEYPQGVGTAFGDFAEQEMVSAEQGVQSLLFGVPFAAVGVGGEALVLKGFKGILNSSKGGPLRNSLFKGMLKGAGTSAVVEGATERIQEEMSVQQKFAIDEDYTQAQANLDRAHALFAGFFGGAGMGAAGGSLSGAASRVFEKARDMTSDVYSEKLQKQYIEEKVGKAESMGDVAVEPRDWIRAQFAAMMDPSNKKDTVWIDSDSIYEFSKFADAQDDSLFSSIYGGTIEKVGGLFTTNKQKHDSFQALIKANPYNNQKIDAFLVEALEYSREREPGDNIAVEVRDRDNNIVWYQQTNAEGLSGAKAKANRLFKDADAYTISQQEIENHLAERDAKMEQYKDEQDTPVIREMLDEEGRERVKNLDQAESTQRQQDLKELKTAILGREYEAELEAETEALKADAMNLEGEDLSNFNKRERRYNILANKAKKEGLEGLSNEERAMLLSDFQYVKEQDLQEETETNEEVEQGESRFEENAKKLPVFTEGQPVEAVFNDVTGEMTEGSDLNPMKGPQGTQYYKANLTGFPIESQTGIDFQNNIPPIEGLAESMQEAFNAGLYSNSLLDTYNKIASQDPNQFYIIQAGYFNSQNKRIPRGRLKKPEDLKYSILKIDMGKGQAINKPKELAAKIKQAQAAETNRQNEFIFKNGRRRKRELKETNEPSYWTIVGEDGISRAVNFPQLTVWGRNMLRREKVKSATREGNIPTLFEGFNATMFELLDQGYQVFYKDVPFQSVFDESAAEESFETKTREILNDETLTNDERLVALQNLDQEQRDTVANEGNPETQSTLSQLKNIQDEAITRGVVYRTTDKNGQESPWSVQRLQKETNVSTKTLEAADQQIIKESIALEEVFSRLQVFQNKVNNRQFITDAEKNERQLLFMQVKAYTDPENGSLTIARRKRTEELKNLKNRDPLVESTYQSPVVDSMDSDEVRSKTKPGYDDFQATVNTRFYYIAGAPTGSKTLTKQDIENSDEAVKNIRETTPDDSNFVTGEDRGSSYTLNGVTYTNASPASLTERGFKEGDLYMSVDRLPETTFSENIVADAFPTMDADEFYDSASRYELGMGQVPKTGIGPEGVTRRGYSVGARKNKTPAIVFPRLVNVKNYFSKKLSKKFGDAKFGNAVLEILKSQFATQRNVLIIGVDEKFTFDSKDSSNTQSLAINKLIEEEQKRMNEPSETVDFETGEITYNDKILGTAIGFRDADIIIINLREGASELEIMKATEALFHELGHVVFRQELQNSLFKRGTKSIPSRLVKAFEEEQQNSRQYEGKFGFEEWYADKVAGYLLNSTKKAENATDSFFKRVAARLRIVFNNMKSLMTKRFNAHPAFDEYADNLVKKYKTATPRMSPISYQDKIILKNMIDEVIPKEGKKAADEKALNNIWRQVENLLSSDKAVPRMIKKILAPADNFIRSLGKNIRVKDGNGVELFPKGVGDAIAQMLYSRSSSEDQTGLLTVKIILINSEVNKLSRILDLDDVSQVTPEAEQILLEAEDNKKSDSQLSPKAREVRQWLTNFYEQYELDTLGLGVLKNYFPRLLNFAALENSLSLQAQLIELLVEFNEGITFERPKRKIIERKGLDPKEVLVRDENGQIVMEKFQMTQDEATKLVYELVSNKKGVLLEGDEDTGETAFHLGLAKHRAQAFKNIPTKVMRNTFDNHDFNDGKWTEKENGESLLAHPAVAVRQYISNSIKRVEYNKRGGAERMAYLVDLLPEDQQQHAIDGINAIIGRVDPKMSTAFRTANSVLITANIITLLAFTVLASLPDLAGPVLKSKEFKSGMRNAGTVLYSYFKEGQYKEAQQFAKEIGVISTEAINTMYINAAELDFMTPKAKKVSEVFFKYTGLEWFTSFTRIFASGMGKMFLLDHAKRAAAGDATSARYLRQLSITPEQIKAWQNNNFSFTGQDGKAVQIALGRFVDESIVRPNAAERPIWASDPRYAVIWQLKSFFYAYGKNIIGGAMRESKNRYSESGSLTQGSYPLVLAALTLLPLSMLGLDLRERSKGGLAWVLPGIDSTEKNYRRSLDMDYGEYAFEVIDRAGIFGPLGLAIPLFQGNRYGDPFWVSPLGPTAEKVVDFGQGDLKFDQFLPIYNQIGGLD